jgi:hypothetical protein
MNLWHAAFTGEPKHPLYIVNIKICINTWKVLKCGAGGGWKRSVGLIM